MRNRESAAVDGVVLLDKPVGPSSNAVLQQVKRLMSASKAGHGGTLDPLASGLIVIMLGEATKFSMYQLEADKAYLTTACLGIETATGDSEGEVLGSRPVTCSDEEIATAIARLRGDIEQIPPMHSALKQAGRPLYALARQGLEVERPARKVRIGRFELLSRRGEQGELLDLEIRCSKGTYIRTLVRDLGRLLDTGAHLQALRRTAAGAFDLADAITLDELQALAADGRRGRVLPTGRLLTGLPEVRLGGAELIRLRHGQPIATPPGVGAGIVRVLAEDGDLVGVAEAVQDGALRPLRLLRSTMGHATG